MYSYTCLLHLTFNIIYSAEYKSALIRSLPDDVADKYWFSM